MKGGYGNGYLGLARDFGGCVAVLVARLIALVLLVLSADALAVPKVAEKSTEQYHIGWYTGQYFSGDAATVCNALATQVFGVQSGDAHDRGDGHLACFIDQGAGPRQYNLVDDGPQLSCPANSSPDTPDDGQCTCNSGFTTSTDGSQCVPHVCPPFGTYVPDDGNKYSWPGMTSGQLGYCQNGCAMTAAAVNGSGADAWASGAGYALGGACGAGSSLPQGSQVTGPAASCKAPTACSGTVNGQTVCVDCGSPTSSSSVTSTSSAASGASAPTAGPSTVKTTVSNGDGTVTTTTTTTNPDGSTSTTTTTGPGRVPGGSSSGVANGTGTGSGSGNCDPSKSACGGGGATDSFGGSCGADFTCVGDAVQCAVAQEQHQRDCTFYNPDTAGGDVQNDAARFGTARTDGDVPSWSPAAPGHAASQALDFSQQIDTSNPLGNTCLADRAVGAGALSLVIPFSQLCPVVGLLGRALVAFTWLACAFIVLKSGS